MSLIEDEARIFQPFSRLPAELRIQIWRLTAFQRFLTFTTVRGNDASGAGDPIIYVKSSTPCPAVMQVCQESRQHATYEKAFSVGSDPRYCWVDWQQDMIVLKEIETRDEALLAHADQVQRLKLNVGNQGTYDSITLHASTTIRHLTALRVLHLVVHESMIYWGDLHHRIPWRSPSMDIRLINPKSGLVFKPEQLSLVYDFHRWLSFDGHGRAEGDDLDQEIADMIDDDIHVQLEDVYEIE